MVLVVGVVVVADRTELPQELLLKLIACKIHYVDANLPGHGLRAGAVRSHAALGRVRVRERVFARMRVCERMCARIYARKLRE